MDNSCFWKVHIHTVTPKLGSAFYANRTIKAFLSQESLKMVYYYFHSIISYGLIFFGNSYYSIIIFRLQIKLSELLLGLEIETDAENILEN